MQQQATLKWKVLSPRRNLPFLFSYRAFNADTAGYPATKPVAIDPQFPILLVVIESIVDTEADFGTSFWYLLPFGDRL